jgi:hypothetical protein
MSRRLQTLVAPAILAVLAITLFGCGSSKDEDTSAAVARAIKREAMERKLTRLQHQLNRRKRRMKTERTRTARKQRSDAAATASTAGGDDEIAALESELNGELGAMIGAPGAEVPPGFGKLESGSAWSTIKVPIALRVLRDVGGPSGLTSAQAERTRLALTISDNDAATALFADLERMHGGRTGASAAVNGVLREAGDTATQISTQGRDGFSSYGQTEWSLPAQHRFMSKLVAGCVGSAASRKYVLGLMGEVSSDTWGLGSTGLPALWKGGWGPGDDGRYLVRQMGILYVGNRLAVVTLAAIPVDGQFETATVMATRVAQWLATKAAGVAASPPGC